MASYFQIKHITEDEPPHMSAKLFRIKNIVQINGIYMFWKTYTK